MKKIRITAIIIVLLLLSSSALMAKEVSDKYAEGFLGKLKLRYVKDAAEYCDLVVQADFDGTASQWQFDGMDKNEFCRHFASKITDGWTFTTNHKKTAYYNNRRLYSVKNYFGRDRDFFVLADPSDTIPSMSKDYVVSYFGSPIKATGWIVFVHKVNGRWLVYKVTAGGVILE